MDRIEHIREMEARMDRLARWLEEPAEPRPCAEEDAAALAAYFEGGLWLADYEADEAGLLPPGLKRGVLSQDGLYDLLSAYRELIADLRELDGE